MPAQKTQLYLSTPQISDAAAFGEMLAAALDAGPVACVRLRGDPTDATALKRAGDLLRPVCHDRDVAIVVQGDHRIAAYCGLDGVHLAHGGHEQEAARSALGPDAIVGVGCRVSRHDGLVAAERGADYVAFGPVAGTNDAERADVAHFEWWQEMIETPVIAEGGVSAEAAAALSGVADFVCADEVVWDHPEGPAAGVRAILDALNSGR